YIEERRLRAEQDEEFAAQIEREREVVEEEARERIEELEERHRAERAAIRAASNDNDDDDYDVEVVYLNE
ncbi:GTPase ObgE, partial [Wenyingzhuangia sp. 1_MG-2023]|nr:GTPase ObgE [Wenyingzhuangia sp. 1_MG-2023]